MSSSPMTRPAIAWSAFAIAGAAWVGLIVSIGMMLAGEGRFTGNPIFTVSVGVAITATVAGIQLRCHAGAARLVMMAVQPARQPATVGGSYRAVARVSMADMTEATVLREIEAEMKGWIARDLDEPTGEVYR